MPSNALEAENVTRILASMEELKFVDFAKRTEAMVETLHYVKENPLYNRVVLIAGTAHLRELARASEDPRLKLTELHRFLLTIPAIVVTMKESG
jgi:erythromycin esterase-like protein